MTLFINSAISAGMRHPKAYILGCGTFGSRAFSFLRPRFQTADIRVIDHRPSQLESIRAHGGHTIEMDAISFLASSKDKIKPDDWIVPAVPIHVAVEWLWQELKPTADCRTMPVPEELETRLPNPIRGTEGQLYVSNADFICPDDCPEPEDCCTVTGEPRPQVLCDTLSNLRLPGYHSTCLVSSQLAPGVGGFQWSTLLGVLADIKAHPGQTLVSTACKCHGVVHAFSYHPNS